MNMISTGAFLSEMDASDKQKTAAEKFAAVWEKKNAKAARAGGVSLMALSLAACGSSSTTTTTTDTTTDTADTTPVTPTVAASQNFILTTANDAVASFTGDTGADTFSGIVDYASGATIGAASTFEQNDHIDGGAGVDTLTITMQNGDVSGTAAGTAQTFAITTADNTTSSKAVSAIIGGVTYTGGTVTATAGDDAIATAIKTLVDSVFLGTATTTISGAGSNVVTIAGDTAGQTLDITSIKLGSTAYAATPGTTSIAAGADGTLAAMPTANVDNVEIIKVVNSNSANVSLDADNFDGVTEIWSWGSTGAVTATDVANETTIGVKGTGDLNVTYKNATSSEATNTVHLAVNAAGTSSNAAVVTATAGTNQTFTILDVATTGASANVDIDGTALESLKTVTISGDGNLAIAGVTGDEFDNVTSVTSTTTGNVTLDMGSNAKVATITLGGGDDLLDMNSGLATTDTVDMGAGNDVLRVSTTTGISSATTDTTRAAINAVSNAEVLSLDAEQDNANAIKMSALTSIDTVRIDAANNGDGVASSEVGLSFTGVEDDDTIVFRANVTGEGGGANAVGGVGASIAAKSDTNANVANITLHGTATSGTTGVTLIGGALSGTGANNGAGIDASTIDTLNIVSSGAIQTLVNAITEGGTTSNAGDALIVAANADIVITGANDLTIGTVSGSSASVDASAFTGDLQISMGAGGNTITGGSGADTLAGGAGDDTIAGGAGDDVLNGEAGNDTFNLADGGDDTVVFDTKSEVGASNYDVINNFTAGTGNDVIRVADASFALHGFSSSGNDGVIALVSGASLTEAEVIDADATVVTLTTNMTAGTFAGFVAGSVTEATMEARALTAMGDHALVATGHFVVAVDDGTDTGLFFVESGGSDAASAGEIALIAIVDSLADATDLVAGNFAVS